MRCIYVSINAAMRVRLFMVWVFLSMCLLWHLPVDAQQRIANQVYAIFEQNCMNCHGPHGAFTEEIIIEHTALLETGAVVPRRPGVSEVYKRLIEKRLERRMPLGQPPLSPVAIDTIRRWILVGAPNWETAEGDVGFISPTEKLTAIEKHVNGLPAFDRAFARYFTMTHLYNAGGSREAFHAYQRALSKLVNSLSWGRKVIKPKPIDPEATIFYIDLRDYEWEIGANRWTQIEGVYPYRIEFNAPTQTSLRKKLMYLRQEMDCEVPFVDVDWFVATASLPPLYHDILGLPQTDRELEARLEVNVVENIRNAAGKRVWRAGFNDSGVSNNNRVVERHTSRYGAYWKSYDFAGNLGTQDVFRHPLSFEHDGGEIIFNLPNGLQAYYLADAGGNRLDAAPINIVSNPAASDPTVRNGLSCIGCHTEGMKDFEDQVRAVIKRTPKPPFDKDRALRLYTEKATMDALLDEDTRRYRGALEAAGGIFGGIEPVQRFYEVFQGPVDLAHAAAAVGLETQVFLRKIRQNASLKNLGLLVLESGTMKRDAWTSKFSEVIFALDFPEKSVSPIDPQTERIPGASVHIPDPNLRAAIEASLGKAPGVPITVEEMATLTELAAQGKGIRDLTGLEYLINVDWFNFERNQIFDLSPFAGLENINGLQLANNQISDLSPLSGLINLEHLSIHFNPEISDLSPIARCTELTYISFIGNKKISDISALAGLINLKHFLMWGSPVSDLSPFSRLTTDLEILDICGSEASDLSPLTKLTGLKELYLAQNRISDVSPLSGLTNLTRLSLNENKISDVSALAVLKQLKWLGLHHNSISDFSPLARLPETTTISRAFNPGVPIGGRKIEGPWLWVTVPGERLDSNTDLLAEASAGSLTEQQVATHGVIQGKPVGNNLWTQGKIAPSGETNIIEMLDEIGSETNRNNNNHIIYGSIILDSPREQDTHMFFGCGDQVKIWLNGQLIYQSLIWRRAWSYHDFFPVTLKQGRNVLLVVIENIVGGGGHGWSGFFGFQEGTEYTVSTTSTKTRVGYVFSKPEIHVDDTFTLDFTAEEVHDLAGWQFDITFDPTRLEAIGVNEGTFLQIDGETTFFRKGVMNNRLGKITGLSSARLSEVGVSGTGTLVSVTFKAKAGGQTPLRLNKFQFGSATGGIIPAGPHEVVIRIEGQLVSGDVNRDGHVSVLDMIQVAQDLGEDASANPEADVNGDGVISILDLIAVASHLGESSTSASPVFLAMDGIEDLDAAMLQTWIEQAAFENDGSIAFQEGIAKLKSLLAFLIPKETALLANYPNPFNPETWIPYQLAAAGEVEIVICDIRGIAIRRLALGHHPVGVYQTRSRAAYWDGRNDVGESVASGVYFYTLTAGDFTATRKMLIRK